MNRYFLELAYDGTDFHGWQIQPNAPSIQEEINKNLSKVFREDINVVGAGRTDTGVHASFFVAHFDTAKAISSCDDLVYKFNKMLPKSISIFRMYLVDQEWHTRFDALSREYKYFVTTQKNPFSHNHELYYAFPLDIDAMNEAASLLLQYKDFTSFSKLHTQVKTNDCKVTFAEWEQNNHKLTFTIKADRFLRNMVRAVVGTLFEVGRGKCSIDGFRNIIEQKDRGKAGVSAPGQALFLYDIEYPESYGVTNPKISLHKGF